jgi:hypothetical protein
MRGDFERARLLYRRSRASLEESGYLFSAATTSLDSAGIELLAEDRYGGLADWGSWRDCRRK